MRPSYRFRFALEDIRGRREGRVPTAPMVRVQQKARGRTTGTGRSPAFPARWCYGLYVIFPVTGLSCHRHLAGQVPAGLSASVGAPEPHDFTVRLLRHSSDDVPRPSHLAPNVRDDREPPLLWVRDKREHRFDLPDNAIPGTCDRLARRASHHLACSHPRVSQLSSVAGCGSAAFPSPQCPQLR